MTTTAYTLLFIMVICGTIGKTVVDWGRQGKIKKHKNLWVVVAVVCNTIAAATAGVAIIALMNQQ